MIQLTTEHERLELEKELIKTKILSSKGWYTVASLFIGPPCIYWSIYLCLELYVTLRGGSGYELE